MDDAASQKASGSGSRWDPTTVASTDTPTQRLEPAPPPVPAGRGRDRPIAGDRIRTGIIAISAVIASVVAGAAVGLALVGGEDPVQNTGETVQQDAATSQDGPGGQWRGDRHEGRHR